MEKKLETTPTGNILSAKLGHETRGRYLTSQTQPSKWNILLYQKGKIDPQNPINPIRNQLSSAYGNISPKLTL